MIQSVAHALVSDKEGVLPKSQDDKEAPKILRSVMKLRGTAEHGPGKDLLFWRGSDHDEDIKSTVEQVGYD